MAVGNQQKHLFEFFCKSVNLSLEELIKTEVIIICSQAEVINV